MNVMLLTLLLAAAPDAPLLERLGARAVQLETFANASRATVEEPRLRGVALHSRGDHLPEP